MTAKFVPIGEPAHDAERQAIRFLVEGLPDRYTVYGNPWLVERSGVIYELDAVVVAPQAVFVVEIKSYRGIIQGTDNDWWTPDKRASPLKLNRKTAQVLKSHLRDTTYQAGQVWTEGFVFLSATTDSRVRGLASNDRVHTRLTLLAALQSPELIERLSGGRARTPSSAAERELLELFTGAQQRGPKPVRRVREYEIVETLDASDTFTELLGKNALSGAERVLRIYSLPPLGTDAQRDRVTERARWEAQVLGRLGRSEGILTADPPFSDEAGIVLPLEHFKGITLATWIERYGGEARGKEKVDLPGRVDLWLKIAQTLDDAHRQGVVHRLLRPEVVLVEDRPDPEQIRVTGFDLAKQLASDVTIAHTAVGDDRLVFAAPEVVTTFSAAEPASDQFSLGALLALVLTGKPLFDSTRRLMGTGRLVRRLRDTAPRIRLTLDEAVARMLELRPTDRYPTLAEAIAAVRAGRDPETRTLPGIPLHAPALDPDNLQEKTRVGTDYEILGRLGQGGMAVVYAARHIVSGRTRALKVARAEAVAEEALRGEYQELSKLDHPAIVKVLDLTKMVEGRLTLVMERVGGENLRQWLAKHAAPAATGQPGDPGHAGLEPNVQRRLAEDLLSGLDYLEQRGVTHKDLKPDNLLVDDGRLIVIDFSLAAMSEDAPYGGTALYRDPSSARWTHATDRFAAALCLFELYAGRHAFDGRVPEPGQEPQVREDDIEPPGLAAFFKKALHPVAEQRYPSARAMRDALLVALGEDPLPAALDPHAPHAPRTLEVHEVDATTPLRLTRLPRRAIVTLARNQVHTAGELLALPEAQVRAIHAIGSKTASDIVDFQDLLRARGLAPASLGARALRIEPSLVPDLSDSPEPVDRLPLGPALRAALMQADLPTVGAVASLTHAELHALDGIGRTRLAQVVEALHAFRDSRDRGHAGSSPGAEAHTLDRLWELAAAPLTPAQRVAVERCVGLTTPHGPHGHVETQSEIAADLGKTQPQVSHELSQGLERLDLGVLARVSTVLEDLLDGFGGLVRLGELGERLEEEWPAGIVTGAGLARLLARVSSGRAHLLDVEGVPEPVLARPLFDRETLRAFTGEVLRIAGQWPLTEPDAARRSLLGILPHFDGDPLSLGVRLCEDVELAETGHLFVGPLDPHQSLAFVLDQARDPLDLEKLKQRVRDTFGPRTPYPEPDHLLALLRELDCRVIGHQVIPGHARSIVATAPLAPDAPPSSLVSHSTTTGVGAARRPEEELRDRLRDAASTRGFRMLVVPPERLADIGRSVAAALPGATYVSFEDAFFEDHGAELPALERAERFVGQREALTEAAESTLFRLLGEHGAPGRVTVLGETALLGLCEALDLPRRLYDEALSGSHGFWVLVVPGVIHNRQPRFNEGAAMWHLEGATLGLATGLPVLEGRA